MFCRVVEAANVPVGDLDFLWAKPMVVVLGGGGVLGGESIRARGMTPPASTFESKAKRWTRWDDSAILAPLSLRTEHAQLQSTTASGKPGSDYTKAISFGAYAV